MCEVRSSGGYTDTGCLASHASQAAAERLIWSALAVNTKPRVLVRLLRRHRREERRRTVRQVMAARVRQRQAAVILRRVERGDCRRTHAAIAATAGAETDVLAQIWRSQE